MTSRLHRILSWSTVALVFLAADAYALQQPAPPVPPPDESSSSVKPKPQRHSHADDFLIRGTVFNDKALSFPGVRLRVRRSGEKKFRWEAVTNSRGEFALRLPPGSAYELIVGTKGYADQTRAIDAKQGGFEGGLIFRLQPQGGKP